MSHHRFPTVLKRWKRSIGGANRSAGTDARKRWNSSSICRKQKGGGSSADAADRPPETRTDAPGSNSETPRRSAIMRDIDDDQAVATAAPDRADRASRNFEKPRVFSSLLAMRLADVFASCD